MPNVGTVCRPASPSRCGAPKFRVQQTVVARQLRRSQFRWRFLRRRHGTLSKAVDTISLTLHPTGPGTECGRVAAIFATVLMSLRGYPAFRH